MSVSMSYTDCVAKTNAAWFGDQSRSGGRSAIERIFYVPTLLRTLFGRAIAGIPSGMPGSLISGSPTLLSARPPHLAMDGGPNLIREAAMRANTLARLEPTSLTTPVNPATERTGYEAGKEAARAWFDQLKRSAADHRDFARYAFVRALEVDDSEAAMASILFNQGFAEGIAQVIAGVRHD